MLELRAWFLPLWKERQLNFPERGVGGCLAWGGSSWLKLFFSCPQAPVTFIVTEQKQPRASEVIGAALSGGEL